MLYPKLIIDKKIFEYRLSNYLASYKNHVNLTTLPSSLFKEIIQTLKKEFGIGQNSPEVESTFAYWYKFVSSRLDNSHRNRSNIYSDLVICVKLTCLLTESIKEKNIYFYSDNEIKELCLYQELPKTWSLIIIKFLRFINSKRITKYNIDELVQLRREIEKPEKTRETDIYTTEDFMKLINYVNDINYHKPKAIKELYMLRDGKRVYYEYSSVWLYIMMHLNNAWRSSDIINKIPRISLPPSIDSIEKFQNHELSTEEETAIMMELSGKLLDVHHNKNLKQAYFFCSQKLEKAFINALIICELKCRKERPLTNQLIHLDDNNSLNKTLHDSFFEKLSIPGFKFSSLRANRSYMKNLKTILNYLNVDNVMTVLELQRNHGSLDVTKQYTPVSTDEANEILKNLSVVGYFGYTYTLLTKIILGKQGSKITTKAITLLKEVFGDIYKIENFTAQINEIDRTHNDVIEYFDKLKKDELENLHGLITLGNRPAKEDHWQCILGDCIYIDRNCECCPFAIPNYYVLNSILKKLTKHLEDYSYYMNLGIEGELVKSSNLIHRYLLILSAAKQTFGETAISSFLGYEYTTFKNKLSEMEDFKYYLYLRKDCNE